MASSASRSLPSSSTSPHSAQRSFAVGPPGWLREPLLHFLLLGAVLFAVDHFLVARQDDPRRIVVDRSVDGQAIGLFEAARGRKPDAKELSALRQVWLDNEVLYREGLALQVDKGDSAIRERVIFKALSVVDAGIKLPPVTEPVLREWFDAHRDKYDEPARYDFQEAVLPGDTSESAVRDFVARLNGANHGNTDAGLRVFKGRPIANLDITYGPEFAPELDRMQIGEWRAVRTREGWRALQLNAITAAKPASFATLIGVVRHDWADAIASEQRTTAVRELRKKYDVRIE